MVVTLSSEYIIRSEGNRASDDHLAGSGASAYRSFLNTCMVRLAGVGKPVVGLMDGVLLTTGEVF